MEMKCPTALEAAFDRSIIDPEAALRSRIIILKQLEDAAA
jgi:hypothetical protein